MTCKAVQWLNNISISLKFLGGKLPKTNDSSTNPPVQWFPMLALRSRLKKSMVVSPFAVNHLSRHRAKAGRGRYLASVLLVSLLALPAATMAQTNQSPTASISPSGPISMVTGEVMVLTGSGNDPDGGTVTYAWSLTDDSGGTVDAANATLTAANTDGTQQNFSVTTAGDYIVKLVVTDDESTDSAPEMVTINVAENQAPTAVITHSFMLQEPFSWITSDAATGTNELLVLLGVPVSLSGLTSTDPNGFDFSSNPAGSFSWSVTLNSVDVTSTTLIGTNNGRTTFSGSATGTYTVELTVSDGLLESSQTAALSIKTAATFPPTVTIDPSSNQNVNLSTDLVLTANAMDPDGDSVFTYVWTATDSNGDDVTRHVLTGANAAMATLNSFASGEYSISVMVTDDDGETATSEPVTVTVGRFVVDDSDDTDDPGGGQTGQPQPPQQPVDPENKIRLAQLGRVLSHQVMDAVQDRLSASRVAGFSGTLAGQALPKFGDDANIPAYADSPRLEPAASIHGRSDRLHKETRSLTTQSLLAGSRFSLTSGSMDDRSSAIWGHVSISNFEGTGLNDSEMTTALLGADWVSNRLVSGLALSHSTGEGSWLTMGSIPSSSENTITGLYPYFGYDVSDRMSVWGVVGYAQGEGEYTISVPGVPVQSGDLEMLMFAGGTANNLMSSASGDSLTVLSLKTDVVLAQSTAVDQLGQTPELNADSNRFRLALEAAWQMSSSDGGAFRPSAEVGLRRDDGDAVKGLGIDIGAGFGWNNPASGVSTELRGRMLMTHASKDFSERNISGSFAWDPSPGSAEGANLTVNYLLGGSATGGVEALFAQDTISAIGANSDQQKGRMEVRLGYGLPVLGGRFIGTPETSFGYSDDRRDVSLGWGLTLIDRSATGVAESFDLSVEARRQENADDGGFENAVVFQLKTQF